MYTIYVSENVIKMENFLHAILMKFGQRPCTMVKGLGNVIKILGDFGSIFWKKAWAIVQGFIQKLGDLKKGHNSKI